MTLDEWCWCGGRCVMVQGNKLTAEEQQVTEESATYRAEWVTTGMTKCKKGERQTIHVQLQVTCLLVSFGLFSHFLRSIFKRILELQLSLAPNDTRSRKSCLSRHKVDRYFNCAKIRFYNCTRLFRSAHFAVKSSWLCYPFAIFVCAARYGANFWVKYPLWVNQPGQLSLPSLRGR